LLITLFTGAAFVSATRLRLLRLDFTFVTLPFAFVVRYYVYVTLPTLLLRLRYALNFTFTAHALRFPHTRCYVVDLPHFTRCVVAFVV